MDLLNIVSSKEAKLLLNRFYEATGMNVLITDNLGKVLAWNDCPNLFCEFCSMMRSDDKTRIECEKSDAFGGISASYSGKPFIYRCHMDLVEAAIPVVIGEKYSGVISLGEVVVEESEHNKITKCYSSTVDLDSMPGLREAYEKTKDERPFIPLEKFISYANLMQSITNYITAAYENKLLKNKNTDLENRISVEEKTQIELRKKIEKLEVRHLDYLNKQTYLIDALNTINSFAILEKPVEASELISCVAKLVRYNLYNANGLVTVEEELNMVRNQAVIREASFGIDNIIEMSVDNSCFNALIPPFSIYLFVENFFEHIRGNAENDGKVLIDIMMAGKNIKITIKYPADDTNISQARILNLNKLCKYYYAEAFNVNIENSENHKTIIELAFPYLLNKEERGGLV